MSEEPKTYKPQSDSDYQRISFSEFLKISKWVIGIIYKLHPVSAIVYLISVSLFRLQDLAWAYIYARLIDWLINLSKTQGATFKDIIPILIILVVYSLFETLVSFARSYSQVNLRYSRPWVRQLFVKKLNELGIQTLEQPGINDKIFRSREYLGEVVGFYFSVIDICAEVIKFIAAAAIIIKSQPYFSLIISIVYIPYLIYDKNMRIKAYKLDYDTTLDSRISADCLADIGAVKALTEINIIRAFKFFEGKFLIFQTWFFKTRTNMMLKWRSISHLFGFLADLVMFGAYAFLFMDVILNKITIGGLTFTVRALNSFSSSLRTLTQNINDLMENSLRFKDLYTLFMTKPIVDDGVIDLGVLSEGPAIELNNVDFKYPNANKYVFKNLNLKIRKGEKLAIVGQNGAGKTTLVRLIARFYQLDAGQILINSTDLKGLKIDTLYQNMGVLWQDFNIHPQLTVKENVYIGKSEEPMDEARISAALDAADATNFVNEYPKKLDQVLSERFKGGIRPSTGQWQKIAIARFFYRNAPLIIFDEPTASIDAVSESNIFKRIYDFFQNKTVIIISHRFSTVRNADRIIVMDEGAIVEEGSHAELMNLNGRYAQAFKLQAEGYKDNFSDIHH